MAYKEITIRYDERIPNEYLTNVASMVSKHIKSGKFSTKHQIVSLGHIEVLNVNDSGSVIEVDLYPHGGFQRKLDEMKDNYSLT